MPQNIFNSDAQIYSIANYLADGATDEYAVPFPYLYKDDVHVYIDGEEITLYPTVVAPSTPPPISFDAYWISDDRIKFVEAPTADSAVLIQRMTNKTEAEVIFRNSSILHEEDLNTNTTQLLYVTQEAYDALNVNSIVERIEEATEALERTRIEVEATVAEYYSNYNALANMSCTVEEAPTNNGFMVIDWTNNILRLAVPRGPKGDKGDKGDQGIQGIQGIAGPAGPQGPTGDVSSTMNITFQSFAIENGNLVLKYGGDAPGTYSINNNGELEVSYANS